MERESFTLNQDHHKQHMRLERIERFYQKIRGLPPPIEKIETIEEAVARRAGLVLENDRFSPDFDPGEKY